MSEGEGIALDALDDAALARRAGEGDRDAFEAVVERYHALVLVAADRVVGNRDDAFDVGQDVFLKAYLRMGELRRPERLGPWLLKIARNHALGVIRRRRHERVEFHFGEAVTATGVASRFLARDRGAIPSAAAEAEHREMGARIREKLRTLGREYRETLRMFYLEGIGLPEIARRLGVPLGTAKWRLSRARRRLRKELMMSELSDGLRNEATSEPLLVVTTVSGAAGPNTELRPWEVTKTLLAQQILFAVRKEPMTAKAISREVKADVSYVDEHVAKMTEAEVLEEEDGRYRANCILFDLDDMKRLKKEFGRKGREAAAVIARHADELSAVMAKLAPSAQGIDEGLLRWIILPTMVLNFGVGRKLEREKGIALSPPARPCGGRWFFLPRLAEAKMPVELGCNVNFGRDGFAQYWNSELGITITRPSMAEIVVVHRLGEGPVKKASLVDVFSEETVAGMIEHGLARAEEDGIAASVPVFTPADGDLLDPVLTSVIDDVIDRAYADYPDEVYAVLDSMGFSFARSDYPAHAEELAQMGAVRALVDEGVLPPAPRPAPAGWGFFAWNGTFAPMEPR